MAHNQAGRPAHRLYDFLSLLFYFMLTRFLPEVRVWSLSKTKFQVVIIKHLSVPSADKVRYPSFNDPLDQIFTQADKSEDISFNGLGLEATEGV